MEYIVLSYWVSLFILIYIYFGYPAFIIYLAKRKRKHRTNPDYSPFVSLIICAYNEENIIGKKIDNSLSCDYYDNKYEIIVVSDGSTDKTNEIVNSYDDRRIKFIYYPDRGGKAKALNKGMENAKGEVIVFTDANVMFESDAIRELVSAFSEGSVGCAVGNVILKSPVYGEVSGEGIYSRYEKAIHTAEANFATMITVDGAMYAVRREYLSPIPPDSLTDDWYLASGVLGYGKSIVYVPRAVGYEKAAETVSGEFVRKIRMAAGGYQTMIRRANIFLNPFSYPKLFFMFFSHKLLRWNSLLFMALFYILNLMLVNHSIWYQFTLVIQICFYTLALFGWIFNDRLKAALFYIPYYFVSVNWAVVLGLIKYLTNAQKVTWERGRK